jgi:hypothetical protein
VNPAENYILDQPEAFRSVLLHLCSVVERTVVDVDLKYKYRIPFYYIDGKPFCYLNHSKDYVDLGFWNGNKLTKHLEFLTTEKRKLIKSLRYKFLEEIDDVILIEVLKDAYAVRPT